MSDEEILNDDEVYGIPEYALIFDEDAKDFVEILRSDPMPTTQNGYGRTMALLSQISKGIEADAAKGFLAAMDNNGYDTHTVESLNRIMGW